MDARVRIVMATYNQAPLLRLALAGYLRQTERSFRLVLADDGSGPETREVWESYVDRFAEQGIGYEHVWQEDEGYRRAAVLNEGVRLAGSEPLLVFTDGDCIPPAHYVERHLAAHAPRSLQVGGVNFLTVEQTAGLDVEQVMAGAHEGMRSERDRKRSAKRRRQSFIGTFFRRKNRPKIWGANCALDRGLFEELNGYDEAFEGWGYEDSDLRNRAMRLRPRPVVRVLYGENDVFHLHPPAKRGDERHHNRERYRADRPARCTHGLHPDG